MVEFWTLFVLGLLFLSDIIHEFSVGFAHYRGYGFMAERGYVYEVWCVFGLEYFSGLCRCGVGF